MFFFEVFQAINAWSSLISCLFRWWCGFVEVLQDYQLEQSGSLAIENNGVLFIDISYKLIVEFCNVVCLLNPGHCTFRR